MLSWCHFKNFIFLVRDHLSSQSPWTQRIFGRCNQKRKPDIRLLLFFYPTPGYPRSWRPLSFLCMSLNAYKFIPLTRQTRGQCSCSRGNSNKGNWNMVNVSTPISWDDHCSKWIMSVTTELSLTTEISLTSKLLDPMECKH